MEDGVKFQKALLKIQVALENAFYDIAEIMSKRRNIVILCDRGLMDGSAYVEPY